MSGQDLLLPTYSTDQDDLVAVVRGEVLSEIPKDLYIPPDALEVILEAFEGPLDLLLYLIRRQNLDILDIPVAKITEQYMGYIEMMSSMRFDLAAEYLLMAATLAEIKSRMLLPRVALEEEEADDPRAELVRRLQEYERFKKAAQDIDELPRLERDTVVVTPELPDLPLEQHPPDVDLKELLLAFRGVLERAEMFTSHQIQRETLSVRERMSRVLNLLQDQEFVAFEKLFDFDEGRMGAVVSFLAVLELVKETLIKLSQNEAFGSIYVRRCEAAQE
jgi:segregation and condensation protein A